MSLLVSIHQREDSKLLIKSLVLFVFASLLVCYTIAKGPHSYRSGRSLTSNDLDGDQFVSGDVPLVVVVVAANEEQSLVADSTSRPCTALQPPHQYDTETVEQNELNKTELDDCEIIHLAFVCGGIKSMRNFYVLLKSLLFYRKNPITAHVFADNTCKPILKKLIANWTISNFNAHLYNYSRYVSSVNWVPSSHYSGDYGLAKLVLPTILFKEQGLDKVIVLDTDILALADIGKLWTQLKRMQVEYKSTETAETGSQTPPKPLLAMVENQSDWYLKYPHSRRIWPAKKRGYNSGVVLMNLQAMNDSNWTELWRSVAMSELSTMLQTSLADQDIFNAVIKRNPSIVADLQCEWNVQFNANSKHSLLCNTSPMDYKLVHMNSPRKFDYQASYDGTAGVVDTEDDYFKTMYENFQAYPGSLLTSGPVDCSSESKSKVVKVTTEARTDRLFIKGKACDFVRPKPSEQLRMFINFFELQSSKEAELDVTLVTQLSFDRVQALERIALHWQGPISAALYLSEIETSSLIQFYKSNDVLANRRNIAIHLVFKETSHLNYPINKLRNIAVNGTNTKYVFLVDVDFVSSPNLYETLRFNAVAWTNMQKLNNYTGSEHISISTNTNNETTKTSSNSAVALKMNLKSVKKLLVVPAFETQEYKPEFARHKMEFVWQIGNGKIKPFRYELWPQGQNQTDYERWKTAEKEYQVEWKRDYEPFVMAEREVLPAFDERFVGFGWNKVSHAHLLAAQGFEFWVQPNVYVVHLPHAPSLDLSRFRKSSRYASCVRELKSAFEGELREQFPSFAPKLTNEVVIEQPLNRNDSRAYKWTFLTGMV